MDESSSSGNLSSQPCSEHFREFLGTVGVTAKRKEFVGKNPKTRLDATHTLQTGLQHVQHTTSQVSGPSPRSAFSGVFQCELLCAFLFLSRIGTNQSGRGGPIMVLCVRPPSPVCHQNEKGPIRNARRGTFISAIKRWGVHRAKTRSWTVSSRCHTRPSLPITHSILRNVVQNFQ